MRDRPTIPAGTFTYDNADLETGWHSHDLHQIEYALEGIAEVETADTRYLLPPHQAMWLPAGCEHRTTLRGVHSIAVFSTPRRWTRSTPAPASSPRRRSCAR